MNKNMILKLLFACCIAGSPLRRIREKYEAEDL